MNSTPSRIERATRRSLLLVGLLPLAVQASFIDDSSGRLDLRNFYQLRDFRQHDARQSQAGDWSQAFVLRLQSGFTEGTVGFGLDATGLLGVKLDSGAGRSGDGTLPFGPQSHEPVDNFSHAGLTAKVRYAKSQLNVGLLEPQLPVVFRDDTRLLPQTFQGALLTSSDVDKLTLTVGQLWQNRPRNSSAADNMYIMGRSNEFNSNQFNIAGAGYALTQNLSASYFYGQLKDIYHQQYVGLLHDLPLRDGLSLRSDLRYFDSNDDGQARSGAVDNRNLSMMFTLRGGAHSVSVAYQKMMGDNGFPTLNGYTPPYSPNLMTVQTFTLPGEKSWQLRYDYDFASLGLPGLTFMTRYARGDDIELGAGLQDGHEYERDSDLAYTLQSESLKGLSLRWRNASVRTSYGPDIDENRLIANYSIPLW